MQYFVHMVQYFDGELYFDWVVTHFKTCLNLSRRSRRRGFVFATFDVRASTQPQNNNKAFQR